MLRAEGLILYKIKKKKKKKLKKQTFLFFLIQLK